MILLVSFAGSGLLIAALAIPLALGNVPPNPWYGVRVRATRKDPRVWYYVNTRSGRDQISVGVINLVVPIALYYTAGLTETAYTYSCIGVLFASLGIMMARAMRYTRIATTRFDAVGGQ